MQQSQPTLTSCMTKQRISPNPDRTTFPFLHGASNGCASKPIRGIIWGTLNTVEYLSTHAGHFPQQGLSPPLRRQTGVLSRHSLQLDQAASLSHIQVGPNLGRTIHPGTLKQSQASSLMAGVLLQPSTASLQARLNKLGAHQHASSSQRHQ